MKKIFAVAVCLLFMVGSVGVFAGEDAYSPITTIDLSISGTTTALNKTLSYAGTSWFYVDGGYGYTIDIGKIKPNFGIFSIQPYQITLANSNVNNVTLVGNDNNSSGSTYYIVYSVSNKDDPTVWAKAGVTSICGPIQLSGSTAVVQTFPAGTPEFARYMRIGVVTGMTQFSIFKTTLAVQ